MSDAANTTRPWWMAPGPVAFGGVIVVAAVAVGWQGFAEARRPVDVRAREQQVMRGGSFCDVPSAPKSSATPPPGSPLAADPGLATRR